MEKIDEMIATIVREVPRKVVISNPLNKDSGYLKIIFLQKMLKDRTVFQIEKYTQKQVFHQSIEVVELGKKIIELMSNYRQADIWTENFVYGVKISKKGKVALTEAKSILDKPLLVSHNRKKNYILKEGVMIEPLVDLGIFSKDGKVINGMHDKYKQINRFIELVDDEIKGKTIQELTVIDFGCGKSYLTFILYYYLVHIKNIHVKMIGLDLKEDVISHCNEIAKKYQYEGLTFSMGDISRFSYNGNVDMVITLHACDTATDFALFNAIKWNAKMIFSAPCCQHELNAQVKSDSLSALTKYGIIKERTAALMTDAIRGCLLEVMGYKTQLLEFIDISHSPKNILIRAIKSNVSQKKKHTSLLEAENLMQAFSFEQTLYNLLKNEKLIKNLGIIEK